jgi:membrane protease YdiL (CAAX protease family)
MYGSLRYVMDKHVAVALTRGMFTLMHLQYEVAVMLLILPIGVVLGYARANTGSIWVPVLLHMLNNLYERARSAGVLSRPGIV